jgi:hypothetical protein
MAIFRAKCWLGSNSGYQDLQVESNTINGAYEQFERRYGAEQIINCRRVGSNESLSGNSIVGIFWLGCFLGIIWLFLEYTWVMVPLSAISLILLLYLKYKHSD